MASTTRQIKHPKRFFQISKKNLKFSQNKKEGNFKVDDFERINCYIVFVLLKLSFLVHNIQAQNQEPYDANPLFSFFSYFY